jgi:hypothetical protein
MDRTLITLTPANVITVTICGLLGYGILVGLNKLFGSPINMNSTTGAGS